MTILFEPSQLVSGSDYSGLYDLTTRHLIHNRRSSLATVKAESWSTNGKKMHGTVRRIPFQELPCVDCRCKLKPAHPFRTRHRELVYRHVLHQLNQGAKAEPFEKHISAADTRRICVALSRSTQAEIILMDRGMRRESYRWTSKDPGTIISSSDKSTRICTTRSHAWKRKIPPSPLYTPTPPVWKPETHIWATTWKRTAAVWKGISTPYKRHEYQN